MTLEWERALGQMLLHTFTGRQEPPPALGKAILQGRVSGVELLRHKNIGTPAEVRALTAALQRLASEAGQPPLLVAVNQEGGQLIGIGGSTPFPGNMALGATRSSDLARRVGAAMGKELRALGINVNFAPVLDVNNNPRNPVIGTRSFGDTPALVARLGVAMIRGLQSSGVAATAKHFPGHGDSASDSHLALPVIPHSMARLRRVELRHFGRPLGRGSA